jgi:hypothetical protein
MAQRARLLAVASGGGHWIELLRLRGAFADWDTAYVSMFEDYASAVPNSRYYTVPDASRFKKLAFLNVGWHATWIVLREWPTAIVTTGSAPMLCFILLGRLLGAKTLWIDSIAQAEEMSSSGRLARRMAHCTVSQWAEVAEREDVLYWGAVL